MSGLREDCYCDLCVPTYETDTDEEIYLMDDGYDLETVSEEFLHRLAHGTGGLSDH